MTDDEIDTKVFGESPDSGFRVGSPIPVRDSNGNKIGSWVVESGE